MVSVSICSIIAILCILETLTIAELERKFVSVLFRHGDRTPIRYTFGHQFPGALGELTKAGMQREYELGQHIREEYSEFLDEIYDPRVILTRSTDYDRTKMSLQLVMAGIFPPTKKQRWNKNINWQPAVVDYVPGAYDFLLTAPSCPKYAAERNIVMALPEVKEEIARFNDLVTNLNETIGEPVQEFLSLAYLYIDLVSIKAMGYELPSWSFGIFPNGALLDAMILTIDIMSYNQKLIKLNGGMILKNFTDTASAIIADTWNPENKMLLLSAHDVNIAALLIALDIFEWFEPQYSSAIFIELLKDNYQYYVRIYYYKGIPEVRHLVAIPNCEDPCSFSDFMVLYSSVLPTKEEMCSVKIC